MKNVYHMLLKQKSLSVSVKNIFFFSIQCFLNLKFNNCTYVFFGYRTLESFEADLNLVFENCMFYNSKTSIYYCSAKTLKDKVI